MKMLRAKVIHIRTQRGPLRIRIAADFMARACGLLFSAPLPPAEALLILPCCRIHTFGMRDAIDAVFIDRGANVVDVIERLQPWRIAAVPAACAVLEMAAGGAAEAGLYRGTRLAGLESVLP